PPTKTCTSRAGPSIRPAFLTAAEGDAVKLALNLPLKGFLAQLSQYPASTRLSLTGTIIVGRDIAHAKLKARIESGEDLPQYIKDHPIYYAVPAKTPSGDPSASSAPPPAGHLIHYVHLLQALAAITFIRSHANRSPRV
ncbi:fumarate hydratase C-terminal domain-containing protein, partial [Salmonella enterica]|uniref:fumarate hydratase C-terminal domain-containing protein n=1 Tax=Salmonella enterica TaxID=28901 RepID=UPI00398C698E